MLQSSLHRRCLHVNIFPRGLLFYARVGMPPALYSNTFPIFSPLFNVDVNYIGRRQIWILTVRRWRLISEYEEVYLRCLKYISPSRCKNRTYWTRYVRFCDPTFLCGVLALYQEYYRWRRKSSLYWTMWGNAFIRNQHERPRSMFLSARSPVKDGMKNCKNHVGVLLGQQNG